MLIFYFRCHTFGGGAVVVPAAVIDLTGSYAPTLDLTGSNG